MKFYFYDSKRTVGNEKFVTMTDNWMFVECTFKKSETPRGSVWSFSLNCIQMEECLQLRKKLTSETFFGFFIFANVQIALVTLTMVRTKNPNVKACDEIIYQYPMFYQSLSILLCKS